MNNLHTYKNNQGVFMLVALEDLRGRYALTIRSRSEVIENSPTVFMQVHRG